MKITLIMVTSVDGYTTKWDDPNIYSWTSAEDQAHFFTMRDNAKVLIMGRKTFEAAQHVMKLTPKTLRIVLTKNPDQFASLTVPEQLEFTSNSPKKIVAELESKGYDSALMVGGGEVNAAFFQANLIQDMWLTVEPVLFGGGKHLDSIKKLAVNLQLESVKILNKRGTLLVHYTVL